MQIRNAAISDAVRISRLIRSLCGPFLLSPDGAGAEPFFASIGEQAIAGYVCAENFSCLVAEDQDQLAGIVALRDNKHLFHLFVSPAFQGRGLARNLWAAVFNAALAKGNPGEFTVNASLNAVGVYRHFGFCATSDVIRMNGIAFQPMALSAQNPRIS